MSDIVIAKPDASALSAQAASYIKLADAFIVQNDEHRADALSVARELRLLSKQITAHFEPTRKALDLAKKEILIARDTLTAPIDEAVSVIDRKCQQFEAVQQAKADSARKRLEAEALAKQDEQRQLDAAMAETEEAAELALTEALPPPVVYAPAAVSSPGYSSMTWIATQCAHS